MCSREGSLGSQEGKGIILYTSHKQAMHGGKVIILPPKIFHTVEGVY